MEMGRGAALIKSFLDSPIHNTKEVTDFALIFRPFEKK